MCLDLRDFALGVLLSHCFYVAMDEQHAWFARHWEGMRYYTQSCCRRLTDCIFSSLLLILL